MIEKRIIVGMIITTVVIIIGGVFLMSNTANSSQVGVAKNVKVVALQKEINFGTVRMNSGNVVKTYKVKNTGTDVLKLVNMKTSCHCTKAYVTIGSQESPTFGMSGVSSWIGEVKPDETATVTVIFDPAFHGPGGVGQINRFISLETNDASNKKITFVLNGYVTK